MTCKEYMLANFQAIALAGQIIKSVFLLSAFGYQYDFIRFLNML